MSASSWPGWFAAQAAEREASGLTRSLSPRAADDGAVDLAGNDYLGLSRHPEVTRAASDAALLWGAGAGASRLVTGTLSVHHELEHELADFLDQPAALVMSTGYHANLSVVTALLGPDSLIVSDAHIHASLIDAARLTKARIEVVPHNDIDAVSAVLQTTQYPDRRAVVLTESVYSVLGDAAPLVELAEVCAEHDALLLVDEAHGLGVQGQSGQGLVRALGLAGHPHVLVTATLSKSLGSQGGAVLGSPALIDHLVNRARPFIFDTALAPAAAAGALAALRVLSRHTPLNETHMSLPALVRQRVLDLSNALSVAAPAGAVVSVPMPSPQVALNAQAACLRAGVRVGCFRPPSVPDGVSRLRITANAGLPNDVWARAVDTVAAAIAETVTGGFAETATSATSHAKEKP